MNANVLVVEDDTAMRELLGEELTERGYQVQLAANAAEALAAAQAEPPDLVVTDLSLRQDDGLTLCRRLRSLDPDLPVIVITGYGSMEAAIGAIRAGAWDFLPKPFNLPALALAVERGITHRALRREVERLRTTVRRQARTSRLEGVSPAISTLRDQVSAVATTDLAVLVRGESGTGKELVSRELHSLSRRAKAPFVAENLAAIPAALVESALFGHTRGAFTGATESRQGLFRRAEGGTLLLDEIGEMPLELQPKLLRVLEEGRVRPVGSDQEVAVNVRVLAATHQDLDALVHAGRFRADLYYRLAVVEIEVPPLRERPGDILLLAQRFLDAAHEAANQPLRGLHPEAAARLLAWRWPGNVRELKHAMDRAALLARGPVITSADLPARLHEAHPDSPPPPRALVGGELRTLAEVEREHILAVLEAVSQNKAQAARALGIGRKTLYRKLEAWGIVQLGPNEPADEP